MAGLFLQRLFKMCLKADTQHKIKLNSKWLRSGKIRSSWNSIQQWEVSSHFMYHYLLYFSPICQISNHVFLTYLECVRRCDAEECSNRAADMSACGTGACYLYSPSLAKPSQGKRDPRCSTYLQPPLHLLQVPWAAHSGWQVMGQVQPFPPWSLRGSQPAATFPKWCMAI